MSERKRPLCMTEREYVVWQRANANLSKRAASPCQDCTLAFAAEMRLLGQCNGSPGFSEPGRAVRPKHSEKRLLQRREASRRKRERARLARQNAA